MSNSPDCSKVANYYNWQQSDQQRLHVTEPVCNTLLLPPPMKSGSHVCCMFVFQQDYCKSRPNQPNIFIPLTATHHTLYLPFRILPVIINTELTTWLVIIVSHRIIWSWYTGRWWVGCYIWYSEEGTGRGRSPPKPLFAVPNVTAHPSTASVPITVLLYNGPLLCGFNVTIKDLSWRREYVMLKWQSTVKGLTNLFQYGVKQRHIGFLCFDRVWKERVGLVRFEQINWNRLDA